MNEKLAKAIIPASLPVEDMSFVLTGIQNPTIIATPEFFLSAATVIAYGWKQLGQLSPPANVGPQDVTVLKAELEKAVSMHAAGDTDMVVPWGIILPILFNLLQKWLIK